MAFADTDTAAGGPLYYFAAEGTATPDLDDATKTITWTNWTNLTTIIDDVTVHNVEVSENIMPTHKRHPTYDVLVSRGIESFDFVFAGRDLDAMDALMPLGVKTTLAADTQADEFATTDVNATTDVITTTSDYATGTLVQFTTTDTLPAGISLATDYYVIRLTATTIRIATTQGAALIGTTYVDITDQGVGTHTITAAQVGKDVYRDAGDELNYSFIGICLQLRSLLDPTMWYIWHFKKCRIEGNIDIPMGTSGVTKMNVKVKVFSRSAETDNEEIFCYHEMTAEKS